jgi:hypothetical protein
VFSYTTPSTSGIVEGTNLYFTDARARASISVTGAGSYNSTTGVINIVGGVTSFNTRTGAITLSSADVTGALGFTPYNATNPSGYLTGITSSQVTTALGFTPYNSTNPSGYITGITSSNVTTALGFTPYNATNPSGYISGITSGMVTTALGFTPYNSSNPSGYITSAALNPYLTSVTAASTYLSLSGGTLTGNLSFANSTSPFSNYIQFGDNTGWALRFMTNVSGTPTERFRFTDNGAFNTLGAITQNGSQVLTAGNYNSYALPLTGDSTRSGTTTLSGVTVFNNYISLSGDFYHNGNQYILNPAQNGWINTLSRNGGNPFINNVTYNGNTILHAGNFNSYSPTLTGGNASGTWGINVTGYSRQLNGYANQTEYIILDGPANGPVIKVRYDSATANRWIDIGYKDGNGVYSEGLKIYTGSTLTWAGNQVLHAGNYTSYAATASHNHTYDVNNAWLRDANDDANVKLYGNTRQMVFRTDGTTEFASGVGGYAFAWMYGGDSASERRMLLASNGRLWTNYHGWMDEAFASLSHSHSYLPLSGGTLSGGLIINASGGYPIQTTSNGRYQIGVKNTSASAQTQGWWLAHDSGGNLVVHADSNGDKVSIASSGFGFQVGVGSTYDNPGGWGANLVASGTNHGRVRIKATSYNGSGDRETYMWLDNTVNPATGIYSTAPTFVFNGSIGTLQIAGNTVLHAGNYTGYSPSLGGSGASGTWGINITGNSATANKTNANSGYARVGYGMAPFYNWGGANAGAGAPSDSTYTTGIDVGSHPSDQAYGFQIASNMWNVGLWTRSYNGGFGGWVRILDSSNYSSYALPISGGTLSGKLTISPSAGLDLYRLTFDADGTDSWQRAGSGNRHRFTTTGGADFIIGNGSGVATLNGNQLLHAGNYSSYALPTSGGTVGDLRTNFVSGSGGHNFGSSHYSMGKDIANGSWSHPHYSDLIIGYHTGIRIGAAYSGIRFYNNSPTTDANNDGNGDGGEALLMTVGGHAGGSDVIINNSLQLANGNLKLSQGDGTALRVTTAYGWLNLGPQNGGWAHMYSNLNFYFNNGIWINGNRVLDAGNYTSYSPSLGGSGASGTWGINISGTAGNTTVVSSSGYGSGTYTWRQESGTFAGYSGWASYLISSHGDGATYYNQTIIMPFWSAPRYSRLEGGTFRGPYQFITEENISSFTYPVAAKANRANGNFYIDDNYGNGIVGTYASTRYQGVFFMGDSYKMSADGTSLSNMYGIGWSHPNAGGAAGNLTDHGMLIINNGGFRCAISNSIVASGNITAYSDERLKTNWRDMPEDYVTRLAQVKVGIYDRIDEKEMSQVGVSAQSFQKLLPEAILTAKDEMQTLSVSYGNAALASSVELAKEVVDLKTRVAQLEALIEKLIKE